LWLEETCAIIKRFFKYGFSSGTRFKSPASGYESKKEVMSLTDILLAEAEFGKASRACCFLYLRSSVEAPKMPAAY